MSVAFLKDHSLSRIRAGHPWVYSADVLKIEKAPTDGSEITVRAADGGYIGHGFYNSKSRIPIRILSRTKEPLEEPFFRKRLQAAIALRQGNTGVVPETCRLVWSEADFLPGLIVDRYGDQLVIQTLTLAMDHQIKMIARLLLELVPVKGILERNDSASRVFEGLPLRKGVIWGEVAERVTVPMGDIRMEIDLISGQKTGSYLDQIGHHRLMGALAKDRKVLDCFTYHGGFALHAARAGAKAVEAVDISADAIERCHRNAEINQLQGIQWKAANVFDDLNVRQRAGEKHDLVILDPPSFTKSRSRLEEALRGYKEIHLRALMLLKPGGLLATFCCSHHVDAETFRAVALDAAFDVRVILRLRDTFHQPFDHPVIPAIPETEYLKGFLFEVV